MKMLLYSSKDTFEKPFYASSHSILKESYIRNKFKKSVSVDSGKLKAENFTYKHYVFNSEKQRYIFLRRIKKLFPVNIRHIEHYSNYIDYFPFSNTPYNRTADKKYTDHRIVMATGKNSYSREIDYHLALPVNSFIQYKNCYSVLEVLPLNSLRCICCEFKINSYIKKSFFLIHSKKVKPIFTIDLYNKNRSEFICESCEASIYEKGMTAESLLAHAITRRAKNEQFTIKSN